MNENIMNQIGRLATSLEKLSEEVRDLTLEICRAASTITAGDETKQDEVVKEPSSETPKKKSEKLPPASYEDVRGAMSSLSTHGKKAEARALLAKYGVKHLSDVKETDYASLFAEAKELLHG